MGGIESMDFGVYLQHGRNLYTYSVLSEQMFLLRILFCCFFAVEKVVY